MLRRDVSQDRPGTSWTKAVSHDPEAALEEALFRLGLLQTALRKRLLDEQRRIVLNSKDPLGTGFDFSELDSMAEELWQATEQDD